MSLVFRTDQITPLTNDQVDNNFKYLRDQIILKHNISDFTAANISAQLRVTTGQQTADELARANSINAWYLQGQQPTYTLSTDVDKTSIVSRNNNGDTFLRYVYADLKGNADTATLAVAADTLHTPRHINGVTFDGTQDITVADNTKLPLVGGQLTGKLGLKAATALSASVNLGTSTVMPDPINLSDGDLWATTSGVYFRIQGVTSQVAPINSPSFTGVPRAPGYDGFPSQVITLTHLDNATASINAAINLKAPIESPSFTGNPLVPTAPLNDADATIANTLFVTRAIDNKTAEVIQLYQDSIDEALVIFDTSVNTRLSQKADLASAAFTGLVTAPTPDLTTNNTQVATTAFTHSAIAELRNILNGAIQALNDAIAQTRPIPVGTVMFMPSSAVPYGYLEANGQAVSNMTYSALWIALGSPLTTQGDANGTFRVPDLRGEFIRGWDHGRGIDAGRVIGSVQYSQNLEHNHGIPGDDQLSFANGYGGWTPTSRGSFPYDARSSYGGGAQIWNTTTDGGSESRPRNIALMPIIKW